MAQRVDFYVLSSDQRAARYVAACRVTEKAWRAANRVFVHTDDSTMAQEFDSLLWTFKQNSFVPHAIASDTHCTDLNEVMIGTGQPPSTDYDVLINVTDTVPSFYTDIVRVAEFVSATTDSKSKGRVRFRVYRDGGCEIQSHNV